MSMQFRDRDRVCVEYQVRGIPGSEKYPYIDHISTLKEAVAIARTYPGVYNDGAATHIVRQYAKKLPDGHEYHHTSQYTHRWRVDVNGKLQLIETYSREWPTTRMVAEKYAAMLPLMPNRATTLRGQLLDLALVAKKIGLHEAGRSLLDHVYGREALPPYQHRYNVRPAKICGSELPNASIGKSFAALVANINSIIRLHVKERK